MKSSGWHCISLRSKDIRIYLYFCPASSNLTTIQTSFNAHSHKASALVQPRPEVCLNLNTVALCLLDRARSFTFRSADLSKEE